MDTTGIYTNFKHSKSRFIESVQEFSGNRNHGVSMHLNDNCRVNKCVINFVEWNQLMNIRHLIDKNHEIWSVQPEIENAVLISFPVVNSTVDCSINVAVKRAKKALVEMIAVYS